MKEFKVVKEVAEQEYENFCDAFDIDNDVSNMDDDDKAGHEAVKYIIVRAIMKGDLSFDEKSQPVFSKTDTPITFREPKGADLLQMDSVGGGGNQRVFTGLAALSEGVATSKTFASMPQSSLKVCKAIFQLFMA